MTPHPRVLLIDHNSLDRERMAQRLRWEIPGVVLFDVSDADGFSRALNEPGYDLVITESTLPWMEPVGILRVVKARWPRCPVLVASSAADEAVAVAVIRAGAADYFPKSPGHLAVLATAAVAALQGVSEPAPDLEEAGRRRASSGAGGPARLPDHDPDPVLCIDATGRLTYANPASAELLREWDSRVGRPVPALWRTLTAEVLERKGRRVVEAAYGERTYAFSLLPSPASGEVLVFAADVTPRKHLEEALQESQRALTGARQEADEWLRALDAAPDPVALLDAEGRILRVNQALAVLLRRPPDALTGVAAAQVMNGTEPGPESAITRCLRDREAATEEWTPSGSALSFVRTYAPVLGPHGALEGAILTAKNVTEQQRRDRLVEHVEGMGILHRLASGLAHELNNPLTALIGHAQFLQLAQTDEKVRQRADIIVHEAERMARIIRRLVAFARLRRAEHRRVLINGVIEEALSVARAGLEEHKIRTTLRLDSGLPSVQGDAEQLRQVFQHLLQNADEALASRGGGEVSITSFAASGGVRVVVEDSGPGIPPGILAKVFDPFFTTRGTGEGAGLGLALCHLIVKEHRGAIRASNRPEGGARLEVDLPAEQGADAGLTASLSGAERPRRILVVDDQESVAQFVAGALTLDGYDTDIALGSAAAVARLTERDYDLVLTDFNMPGMRADGLYREVSARRRGVRMAVMTADVDDDAQQFLAETHLPVLEKPFTIDAIQSFVRRLWIAAPGAALTPSFPPAR
jgi:signal transduction histidine kinase/DNA-binding response OmpR family regulator